MSEPMDVEETVNAKGPVRYVSIEQLIRLLIDDYELTGETRVDGREWPCEDQYCSYDLTGLPESHEEREKLRDAIKREFDRRWPVASVTFAIGQDDFSIIVVASRFSDRAPLSLRTF